MVENENAATLPTIQVVFILRSDNSDRSTCWRICDHIPESLPCRIQPRNQLRRGSQLLSNRLGSFLFLDRYCLFGLYFVSHFLVSGHEGLPARLSTSASCLGIQRRVTTHPRPLTMHVVEVAFSTFIGKCMCG